MTSQINYVLVGDIGGTNMRVALADRSGSLVASGSQVVASGRRRVGALVGVPSAGWGGR